MKISNGHLVIKRGEFKPIEILGWSGMLAILLAYLLLNTAVVTSGYPSYQLLNLFGAVAIIIHSMKKRDYQPVVLNIIWGIIALVAIAKIIFKF